MTTSQCWVNVAVIIPTLNQPPHPQILQQKLIPVTSDFLSPATFFIWQKQGRWWQDLLYIASLVTSSSHMTIVYVHLRSENAQPWWDEKKLATRDGY